MLIFNPKIRIKQIWPLVPIDPLINLKLSKLPRICWVLVTFVPFPLTFEISRALCCNITERYFQTNSMEKNAYKSDLKLKKNTYHFNWCWYLLVPFDSFIWETVRAWSNLLENTDRKCRKESNEKPHIEIGLKMKIQNFGRRSPLVP